MRKGLNGSMNMGDVQLYHCIRGSIVPLHSLILQKLYFYALWVLADLSLNEDFVFKIIFIINNLVSYRFSCFS